MNWGKFKTMKCIILAGGFATRLWPLTENKAKPLLHLKDRPMASHIVERLPDHMEIIISTNAIFEEAFKAWIKNHPKKNIRIFVEDSGDDSGKKGALGATSLIIQNESLKDDLLLLAGDNYFGFDMQNFLAHFQQNPLLAAYDIEDLDKAKKFGVVIEKNGEAIEFQEKPDHPKSTLVSTGCFIFPQKNLKDIVHYAKKNNDNLGGIFEYFTQKGDTVNVFKFKEDWVDIGSYEAYLRANKDLIAGEVIEKRGVKKKGENELSGGVYLGENVQIKNSIIESSVILDNSIIENCVIRHCVIDESCDLKNLDLSHKMIRQKSHIEKQL